MAPMLESQDYVLVYDVIDKAGWCYVVKRKDNSKVIDYFKAYREAKLKFYEVVPALEIELFGLKKLNKYNII